MIFSGALCESGKRFRLHYELKASVTREELEKMHRGGLFSVQPGIESFSTHILRIIRKGTTGMQNLELLKCTTRLGINNLYNILTGFHGESEEDYGLQRELIRRIPHLQPPYTICKARATAALPCSPIRNVFRSIRFSPHPHTDGSFRWIVSICAGCRIISIMRTPA